MKKKGNVEKRYLRVSSLKRKRNERKRRCEMSKVWLIIKNKYYRTLVKI